MCEPRENLVFRSHYQDWASQTADFISKTNEPRANPCIPGFLVNKTRAQELRLPDFFRGSPADPLLAQPLLPAPTYSVLVSLLPFLQSIGFASIAAPAVEYGIHSTAASYQVSIFGENRPLGSFLLPAPSPCCSVAVLARPLARPPR